MDLSGELISAHSISRGMQIQYRSTVPNNVIVSNKPIEIKVDDETLEFSFEGGDQGYSVRLPAGLHTAKIFTQTSGAQTLKCASMVISEIIVILGLLAGLILSGLFIHSSVKRRRAPVL